MSENHASEVVFFLGAGASRKAEVPDTFGFVKEFQHTVQGTEYGGTVNKIIETLEKWNLEQRNRKDVDIELLLETLTKLTRPKAEPLLKFFRGGKYILKGYPKKRPIVEMLKDFMRKKATVASQDKVEYLRPLRGFIQKFNQIDIVSVNYDTCIEQFCSVHRLRYEDGFEINWNPSVFDKSDSQIRLYKLHGSVIWYESDRADYIKLPVVMNKARVQLTSGEKAESLMLYPMKKFDYPEPLLDLMVRVKSLLQDTNCKFLVVVGYSFRDYQLVRIVQDAARKNRDLCVVLIDPNASQIYERELKYYRNKVPSSLDGRVVCLPYKFESVFPSLKDDYLRSLQFGMQEVANRKNQELQGSSVKWTECMELLANAEHTEQIQMLLENGNTKSELEDNWRIGTLTYLKMAWNLAANGKLQEAEVCLGYVKDILRRIMVNGVTIEISRFQSGAVTSAGVILAFNTSPEAKGRNRENPSNIRQSLRQLHQYIQSRSQMTTDGMDNQAFEFVGSLAHYLDAFGDGSCDFTELARTQSDWINQTDLLKKVARFASGSEEYKSEIQERLLRIEKQVIAGLLA